MAKRMSTPETAKAVREALKQAFPKTKFSVRSKSYSMGSSISVHWTDGPTTKQVDPILDCFSGAGFDGMQDLKYYLPPCEHKGELVSWGADYVMSSRHESFDALKLAALEVAFECDLPLLEIAHAEGPYGSTHVKDGNYPVEWRFRQGFSSEDQNGFAHEAHPNGRCRDSHAELIYQCARATSFEEMHPARTPNRVTEEFINQTVDGLLQ